MRAPELLAQLRALDVRVWAEGEQVRLSAPRGTLTAELRSQLAAEKEGILSFLRAARTVDAPATAVVAVQRTGTQPPFFAVPGHNGDVFCYVHLSRHLGADQPFYALQPPGVDGTRPPLDTIGDLAAHFARELRTFAPGPYRIGGFCVGGSVAFETARQLVESGERVELLALFGSAHPSAFRASSPLRQSVSELAARIGKQAALLRRSPVAQMRRLGYLTAQRALHGSHRRSVERATMSAIRGYEPGPFQGGVTLFLPNEAWADSLDRPLDWRAVAGHGIETVTGPPDCDGDTMLREPHVRWLAAELRARLGRVSQGSQ